ncbi:MAG: class I SAM-dependent methyltransferase [Tagaea sp.]
MNQEFAARAFADARNAHAAGDFDTALGAYAAALRADPGHAGAADGMVAILEMARAPNFHAGLADLLLLALRTEAAESEALGLSAAHQLVRKYRMADPGQAPSRDLLVAMAKDPLLLATLESTICRDPVFEAFLIRVRTALCAPDAPVSTLPLALALARQAHNNEYVWAQDPADAARLPFDAFGHARRAMYAPLAEEAATYPELAGLVETTIARMAAVRNAADNVPTLTPILDAAGEKVRAMYEANPYPRWLRLRRTAPIDIRAEIARRYLPGETLPAFASPLRVLMPGAGTGQHPLSVAANYADVTVDGIDLSRNSLGYAIKMAELHGVSNIRFAQADILGLPSLGSTWGHIECVGVLHHLADPKAGLDALARVLVPGGLMRVGLYGEHARRIVVQARDAISARGDRDDPAGLRKFRADVLSGALGAALRDALPLWPDFHSASLLRDLCFHVQETRYDVPKLKALLDGLPLRFLGFEFPRGHAQVQDRNAPAFEAYAKAHPDDPAMADLDRWAALEAKNPALFPGYAFWLLRL